MLSGSISRPARQPRSVNWGVSALGPALSAASLTIGILLIAGELRVFDQQWRFYEISPLFVAMAVCDGAAVLSR